MTWLAVLSAFSLLASLALVIMGKSGWGWFLFVALLLGIMAAG